MIPQFYSVAEVASMLKVSVAAVRKWILERRIHFTKVGSLIRFTEQDIEEFINKNPL